ncbi:hypothetical protein FJ208_00845, partial [Candidatus Gribaldobacteria bacterium]|nr:hypothetical protein [Candidatus Gribaldobacteria bacterium]
GYFAGFDAEIKAGDAVYGVSVFVPASLSPRRLKQPFEDDDEPIDFMRNYPGSSKLLSDQKENIRLKLLPNRQKSGVIGELVIIK